MASNKDRLYVALYVRGGAVKMKGKEDTYHWAFLVGPKKEGAESPGRRIHVKNLMPSGDGDQYRTWTYENVPTKMMRTHQLLVRVLVAKVIDRDRLFDILSAVPVIQKEAEFNCVSWIQDALGHIQRDGKTVGTSTLEWQTVRDGIMGYCQKKKDTGRWRNEGAVDNEKIPTYDLLKGKEISP